MVDEEIRAVQHIKMGMKTIKERLEWVLERQIIKSAQESKSTLLSPNFDIQLDEDNTSWYIETNFTEQIGHMSVYLQLEIGIYKNSENIKITGMKFSMKTQDGKLTQSKDALGYQDKISICEKMGEGYGFDWLKIGKLPELYVNDKITIVIDLTFTIEKNEHIRNDTDEQIKYHILESETEFVESIKHFYGLGSFSDLVIFCGDQKFLCHKILLASRSDTFKNMLEDDNQKIKGELEITDTSPDSFKMVIDYIYMRKIPDNIENFAAELFPLATKYNLQNLAKACEISLLGQLTDANALETLVIIDKHESTANVKEGVIKYIVINAKDIIDTEKFKAFSKEQPELMIEIFRCSAVKQNIEVLPTVKVKGAEEAHF